MSDLKQRVELLPCPFCGENCADLVINQGNKWAHYEPGCLEIRTGYVIDENAPWQKEAIDAWNTRALTEREAKLVEAVRFYADADKERSGKIICNGSVARATLKSLGIEGEG